MNKEQVKLWYYLKAHEPQVFSDVRLGLSQQLINAYDAEFKIIASKDEIIQIDRSIHGGNKDGIRLKNEQDDQTNKALNVKLPDLVLEEPNSILAYYLLVFPAPLSHQLEVMLPKEKKNAVINALNELKPTRLPKQSVKNLISFICHQANRSPSTAFGIQKIRVMEKLVDDFDSLKGPFADYCFNPKKDFFLFSINDQNVILNELHSRGGLIPFLIFLNKNEQQLFLAGVSVRQQAFLMDTLKTEPRSRYNYSDSRNAVIDVVRQLQHKNQINSLVKSYGNA